MVPAIAEYSIIAMVLMVSPPMMDGVASASCTVVTTCSGEAPEACATVTRCGGTERREFSTMRAKNAVPARTIGTTAARMPMFVPVTNRVNGTSAAISTRNGSDRPVLTTQDRTVCAARCSNSPPGARLCTRTPIGTPSRTTIVMTMPTMSSVSRSAGAMSAGICASGVSRSEAAATLSGITRGPVLEGWSPGWSPGSARAGRGGRGRR